MTTLSDLKAELVILQKKGRKFLPIEKIVQYCDIAQQDTNSTTSPKLQHQDHDHQMAIWKVEVESEAEGTRLVNDSGFQALKTLVIVAGGSSGALLAFLGSVWGQAADTVRAGLANGLGWFGTALIGATVAYGLGYLTLLCFFEWRSRRLGNFLRVTTMVVVVASYAIIAFGMHQCWRSVREQAAVVARP